MVPSATKAQAHHRLMHAAAPCRCQLYLPEDSWDVPEEKIQRVKSADKKKKHRSTSLNMHFFLKEGSDPPSKLKDYLFRKQIYQ